MTDFIFKLAKRIRPDLESMAGQQQVSGTADVLTLLYSLPLLAGGLVWLVSQSDWSSITRSWTLYLLMGIILVVFNQLRFFFITEIRSGGYANSDGAMDGIAVWSAILLLGPTTLWLKVAWNLVNFILSIRREHSRQAWWSRGRMLSADVSMDLLPTLSALLVYHWAGGVVPIRDVSIASLAPALLAVVVQYLGSWVIYSGYIAYVLWSLKNVLHAPTRPAMSFFFLALTLPALANPFGILAAGIYSTTGIWEFLYLIAGLVLAAVLARRLSQAAEYSRQQSRQIEQLEKLGRALLDEPPDAPDLLGVLRKHVAPMFASRGLVIWTEQDGFLLQEPATFSFKPGTPWSWLQQHSSASTAMPGKGVAWHPGLTYMGPVILCPILDVESSQPIGLIFLELQSLSIPWDKSSLRRQVPAVQSLCAQVASALHQRLLYQQSLMVQRTLQELSLARSIQASFLPAEVPSLPGWQLAATLEPARQIAGDFYDFIQLPGGLLGILVADVADKGLGSALYMALSSTLIRTFANVYHQNPAQVLQVANQNILRNARANLFVTVFFGVLDPQSGRLLYANAGHSPPFLVGGVNQVKNLDSTGMPLGIDEANTWGQAEIVIERGELLILYTDGIPDAQNAEGEFIDQGMLLAAAHLNLGKPVLEIQQEILQRVHQFVGDAPPFDDITLVILGRAG